ncbi:MAG: hypothetical protein FD174_4019 [Geobacteraceae bacterium]|nr:MAG: hypothetical protein FD174_4019 [Geobacteraceae bacterium]
MEKARIILTTLALSLAAVTPAFAASSTRVYSSGVLVLVFLGFCALVVVAQLIPAITTLVGMLKGYAENRNRETAETKTHN